MLVALTGTPGTGKTTLARQLAPRFKAVVTVEEVARRCDAIVGTEDDGTLVIDEGRLSASLPSHVAPTSAGDVLVDGHLSHHLPVQEIWVLRLDPKALNQRLVSRGYPRDKVLQNCESEALDLILQEALECGPRVVQRDGTGRSVEELADLFPGAVAGGNDLEPVDWMHRLPVEGL